jgi:prevent-host-death family protein
MNAQIPINPGDKVVTVHEAKTNLSRLLMEVEAGAQIVVARGKKPIARLVAIAPSQPKRRMPNRFAHLVPNGKDILEDGFWDPLPAEHLGLGIEGEDLKG